MRKAKRRAPDVVALVVMLAVMLLAWPPRALGLDSTEGLGQYQHAAWAAREGLMGSVRAIVQTPDGYLWLGTEFGLVRFDGTRFLRLALPPDQQLPSPRILSLLAARDGTLWIGTYSGLASWRDGRVTRYPEITVAVSSLLEDYQGTIWLGTKEKVCAIRQGRFDCRDDLKSVAPSTYGYLQGGVFSLHEDTQHRLWAGAESGLWQWQPGPPRRVLAQPVGVFQAVVQGDQPTALTIIASSPQGRQLWEVADDKGEMYTVPGLTRPFTPNRLLRDSKGALWIGTLDQGLLYVNHGETTRFAQNDGLSSDFVLAFFDDREGNIWVGTTNGLDRFRESVVSTISASQGLSTPAWSLTSARDGSIWIGSDNGVNRWKDGQLTIYRSAHLPRAGRRTTTYAAAREITDPGLPDNVIGPLTEDTRGRIWVTTPGGAAWFENGRFTRAGPLDRGSVDRDSRRYARGGLDYRSRSRSAASGRWQKCRVGKLAVVQSRARPPCFRHSPRSGQRWTVAWIPLRRHRLFQQRQTRRIANQQGWPGRGPGMESPPRPGRCTLGRHGWGPQPHQGRPRRNPYNQERPALQRRPHGLGRRRIVVMAVHGLRPGANCAFRPGCVDE